MILPLKVGRIWQSYLGISRRRLGKLIFLGLWKLLGRRSRRLFWISWRSDVSEFRVPSSVAARDEGRGARGVVTRDGKGAGESCR